MDFHVPLHNIWSSFEATLLKRTSNILSMSTMSAQNISIRLAHFPVSWSFKPAHWMTVIRINRIEFHLLVQLCSTSSIFVSFMDYCCRIPSLLLCFSLTFWLSCYSIIKISLLSFVCYTVSAILLSYSSNYASYIVFVYWYVYRSNNANWLA